MAERQIDLQSSINHTNNVQFLFIWAVFLLLAVLTAYSVRAQESGQQALSNIELEYTYSDGGAVVLKTERHYQSRKIAAEIYLVNWHDSENSDYVNLVIDLNEMVVHGSALAAYDSETPFAFFDIAKIARVGKLEE
jgi:hypothetical protein